MTIKDEIVREIYNAIDAFADSSGVNLNKDLETRLYGKNSKLDSLGLVSLIVAVEELLEEKFETIITIADERAISQKESPFRTVSTLADYIVMLVEESSSEQ
jgi:D-alanine--poly(phosphoribitol) ligase subunit 2